MRIGKEEWVQQVAQQNLQLPMVPENEAARRRLLHDVHQVQQAERLLEFLPKQKSLFTQHSKFKRWDTTGGKVHLLKVKLVMFGLYCWPQK